MGILLSNFEIFDCLNELSSACVVLKELDESAKYRRFDTHERMKGLPHPNSARGKIRAVPQVGIEKLCRLILISDVPVSSKVVHRQVM